MNKSIRKVAISLAVLLAALFVNLNYVQVVKGNSYRDNPQNSRVLLNEYASPRGDINVGGTAVAHSVATNDALKYLRVYPQGPVFAPVTGFYSLAATPSNQLGTTGIEQAENSVLTGNDPKLFGTRLTDLLTGRNPRGGSVELTLDKASQEAAYQALLHGSDGRVRRGAVVALNPSTGAVLAAVSTPSYDPSQLSLHNVTKINQNYARLANDPLQPMLNRAFNEPYPPGSTFKIVVSAAALKAGIKPTDQLIAPGGYYPQDGRTASSCPAGSVNCIHNFNGEQCDNGKTASLAFAFAKSCNTLFAAMAVEQLGGTAIANEAQLFGFDAPYSGSQPNLCVGPKLSIPIPVCDSTPGSQTDLTAKGFLARTAFGQQDVRMTTLQGAMLASAVANNGVLMQPYLVDRELAPNLSVLQKTVPTQLGAGPVLDPSLDHELQSMMEGVVTAPEGTGHSAAINGVLVAGKTGTADTGVKLRNGQDAPPDAWFVGYAMKGGVARIAVAVIIENGGVNGNETTGGAAAAPVAKAVMEAYLKGHGG